MGLSPRGPECGWRLAGTVAKEGPVCSQDELCCWLLFLKTSAAGWGEIPRGLLHLQSLGPPGQLRGTTPPRSSAGGLRHRGWARVVATQLYCQAGERTGRHWQSRALSGAEGGDAAGPFLRCVGSGVLKSSGVSPRYRRAVAVPLGEMVGGGPPVPRQPGVSAV